MLAAVASIVLYVAAAIIEGDLRPAVFPNKEVCESAVANARRAGYDVTDCVRVELPAPTK